MIFPTRVGCMRVSLFVLIVLVLSSIASAAPNEGIVLESYTSERPEDAAKALAPLLRELESSGYSIGAEVARKFEDHVSRDVGTAQNLPVGFTDGVDRGTKAWVGGKFEEAVALLAPLVGAARETPGAFIGDTKLRDSLLRALIVLGLSQQRLGNPGDAGDTFAELIRMYPTASVARSTYGPEAATLFEQAKKAQAAKTTGRLLVQVTDQQTEVYLDERLERRGTTVMNLAPGDYRVVVQLGNRRSRNHRVSVKPGDDVTLVMDPNFDSVVRTGTWAGFEFGNPSDRERLEATYAAQFAKAIDGNAVVVVSVDTVRGARAVVGSLVLMSGKEIRRASLALDPVPSAERVAALAKFLAGEKATSGIDVQLDGAIPVLLPSRGGGSARTGNPGTSREDGGGRWGGWPWVTGGAAVLALGAGAALLALDGTCPGGSTDPNCPDIYNTATPAWIAIGGGAVLAGVTVYLIMTKPSKPARQAFIAPAHGGAIAGVSGHW